MANTCIIHKEERRVLKKARLSGATGMATRPTDNLSREEDEKSTYDEVSYEIKTVVEFDATPLYFDEKISLQLAFV